MNDAENENDRGEGNPYSGFFVSPVVHFADASERVKHYPWYTINRNPLSRWAKFWVFPAVFVLVILMVLVAWSAWGSGKQMGMSVEQKVHLSETVGNVSGVDSVMLFDDSDTCLSLEEELKRDCFDTAYFLEVTFIGDVNESNLKALLEWVEISQLDVNLRVNILVAQVGSTDVSVVSGDKIEKLLKSTNPEVLVKDNGDLVLLKSS